MALDREEMNKRREKRELARARQRRQQRTRKPYTRRRLVGTLILAAVILVGCGIGIFRIANREQAVPAGNLQAVEETTRSTTEPTSGRVKKDPITTIHIRAVGDLNITNSSVEAGMAVSGYDYTRAFLDVAAELGDADITVMNLEGNFCGEPYGTETASAPMELLTYLKKAGVDLIQTANSYSIYNGLIGLNSTLQAIRTAGMEPLGAYSNPSDFQKTKGYTICDIQGIKVAFVAFTKGLGGMGLPAGSEECVNLLYKDYDATYKEVDTDRITKILNNVAAEKPDLTVAMVHWGSENNDEISRTQEKIVTLMQKKGVDIILGTHPHLVQKIEMDEKKGTLVAYSLGDFFGDGARGGTNYSIILDIEVTKDADLNVTKVTDYSYIPIYTLKESECDGFRRVIRINEAIAAYEGNYVDKVSETAYNQLKYSLKRIKARTTGVEETEETTEPTTEATTTG